MEDWKNIKHKCVKSIEKCVGEYTIWDIHKAPAAKYKIKIYEDSNGELTGYANLKVNNTNGGYDTVWAKGNSVEETLENTLNSYYLKVEKLKIVGERDGVFYTEDANF